MHTSSLSRKLFRSWLQILLFIPNWLYLAAKEAEKVSLYPKRPCAQLKRRHSVFKEDNEHCDGQLAMRLQVANSWEGWMSGRLDHGGLHQGNEIEPGPEEMD